jgi:DNA mismatch repair protein MutL
MAPEHFIAAFISWHDENGAMATMEKNDEMLAHLACKAALRAPVALSPAEMRKLLEGLTQTPRAGFCNHGRPAVHCFALHEMDQWFFRGQ